MRILFDQLRHYRFALISINTKSAPPPSKSWATFKNGDLLTAAEAAGFEVFLTTDKNLLYQQNLKDRKIAIVVLGRQQWPQVRPHAQRVVEAVEAVPPGSYVEVEIP